MPDSDVPIFDALVGDLGDPQVPEHGPGPVTEALPVVPVTLPSLEQTQRIDTVDDHDDLAPVDPAAFEDFSEVDSTTIQDPEVIA